MGLTLSTRRALMGSVGWLPTDLDNLSLWVAAWDMDGNDGGSSGWTDGDAVPTWADKSGNGNNLTEAVNRPTFQNGVADLVNGLPCVRFNGANDQLTVALGETGDAEFSVAMVVKRSRAQTEAFWGMGDNANNAGIGGGWNAVPGYFNIFQWGSNDTQYVSNSTSWLMHISSRDASPNFDLWINDNAGTDSGAIVAANIILDQFRLGALDDAIYAGIDIAEVVVTSEPLSTGERTSLQFYFAALYGITL